MDPVTHALAGGAVADALFRRRLGPRATAVAAVAAASPDIDIAFYPLRRWLQLPNGWIGDWFTHRAVTHSFCFQALAALALGGMVWRLGGRQGTRLGWTLLLMLALWSHSLLDYTTIGGIRLWMPWSWEWYALDALPLLDVVTSTALAISFVACRFCHRRAERPPPLEAPSPPAHPQAWRRTATAVAAAALLTVGIHGYQATRHSRSLVASTRIAWQREGFDATRLRAMPVMFTGRLWYVAGGARDGRVRLGLWNDADRSWRQEREYPSADSQAMAWARSSFPGQWIWAQNRGMVMATTRPLPDDGVLVVWHDLRVWSLSDDRQPPWRAWHFEFDRDGRLLRHEMVKQPHPGVADEWNAFRRAHSTSPQK